MKQVIKITRIEGGYHGCILIKDRIQTALFFSKDNWSKDQVVRRLNKYINKNKK